MAQNKMKLCDCFDKEEVPVAHIGYNPFLTTQPLYGTRTVTRCNGTKERDECSCGGDRSKCDFYKGVREKAQAEKTQMIQQLSENEKKELAFYRDYIVANDLQYEILDAYDRWCEKHKQY